jgi:tetratricopeptide (TPR) repeat protein
LNEIKPEDLSPDIIKNEINKNPNDDTLYSQLGDYYFKVAKNYREALNNYKLALQKNPDNYVYCISIGDCHSQLQDEQGALEWYKKAKNMNPNSDVVLNIIANSYVKLEQYNYAIDNYSAANRINPTTIYFVNLGDIYLRTNEPEKALEAYENALTIDESVDFVHAALGDLYEYLYRQNPSDNDTIEKGIQYYKEALKLNKDQSKYCSRIGDLYFDKGDFDNAITFYNKTTVLDEKDANAFANMGYSYFYKQDYPNALKLYDKALDIDKENKFALKYKGDYYRQSNQYDEAIKFYDKYLEYYPNNSEILISLSEIYSSNDPIVKNIQKALEMALLAKETNPKNYLPAIALSRIYEKTAEYDKGLTVLEDALRFNDKNPFLYLEIGINYINKSNYKQGISSLNEALKLKELPEIYDWLSMVYTKIRKWDQAENYLKLFQQKSLKNNIPIEGYENRLANIYHHKGLDQWNRGNPEEALEEYKKANDIRESDVTYYNMYLCYYDLQKYKEAKEAIEKAIKMISPDTNPLYDKELNRVKRMFP